MFKVTKTLTNVKPAKSSEPEIETAPTPGHFRINPNAYAMMGIQPGDYIAIVEAKTEVDGEEVVSPFAVKGEGGEETDSNFGAKVGAINDKGTGSYSFSSQNSWNALNGNTDEKQVYRIAEPVTDEEGTEYFRLVFDRTEPKIERKSSDS